MGKSRIAAPAVLLLATVITVHGHQYMGRREEVGVYELMRGSLTARFTNYGATMLSLVLPDKHGDLADVVLGYANLDSYKNDTTYFGAIVGRVANRIGGARFTLDGHVYHLPANDGNNTLHGGTKGFSDVVWDVVSYESASHVTFGYKSRDGEEGFPGDVAVYVTYALIGNDKLGVKMVAKAIDKPTPVNMALHTYWNLGGHDSGTILHHDIRLFASKITPVDAQLIPTGEVEDIKGTAFDFRLPRPVGGRINEISTKGYDINFVIDEIKGKDVGRHLSRVAIVRERNSGRKLELWSNQPGVQFYTGNMLKDVTGGKDGAVYQQYGGLCLETQGFPDSVNHPNFPSQIVKPGEIYHNVMVYRFTAH
ncbi:hypothetical protein MLD38_027179 [Melastoma candidum]|uniref:Uncharacterized protein n=1 Tax=Melastoma candidum TaxID=119954 RepID=A0ACB9P0W5_9MYRT|nr:hypothetical protein MLD38_027179 [Melastoma candidum]